MSAKLTIDLQRLKNKDREEVNRLVDTYSDRIYHVCMSYVFNESEAQELTQDVFVACMKAINRFKGGASLYTWLHRIAINKSLDLLKYKKRQRRMAYIVPLSLEGDETGLSYEPIDRIHPGIQLESTEQMTALHKAIHSLPDRQKTALILMKLDGRSQQEVSNIMGIKVKAVESLVQRGKNNLRKKLSEIYDNL